LPRKENITKIKMILNIVGTPFNEPNFDGLEKYDVKELYQTAFNNKIGLLFLESLAEKNKIGELTVELESQRKLKLQQQNTWQRTADVLNKTGCKYVIIKSIFPFPAIPNDVDVLMLGGDKDYRKAIEYLKNDKFVVLDEAALEINLRDATTAKTLKNLEKEWVDIDIYKEVGASHLIYMDKNKLKNYLEEVSFYDRKVSVLKPQAELATNIFHAIYPERIYTLLLHLLILHTIKNMIPSDEEDFLKLCSEQKIENAVLNTLRVTESIQEICFGESPMKLSKLREKFGKKKEIYLQKIPYVYPIGILFRSLVGKTRQGIFLKSFLKQIVFMFNPRTAQFVIKIYKERSDRDTY